MLSWLIKINVIRILSRYTNLTSAALLLILVVIDPPPRWTHMPRSQASSYPPMIFSLGYPAHAALTLCRESAPCVLPLQPGQFAAYAYVRGCCNLNLALKLTLTLCCTLSLLLSRLLTLTLAPTPTPTPTTTPTPARVLTLTPQCQPVRAGDVLRRGVRQRRHGTGRQQVARGARRRHAFAVGRLQHAVAAGAAAVASPRRCRHSANR